MLQVMKILKECYFTINKKKNFDQLTKEISEFSELGEYLNFPIKTYSSGMLTRLSFSIATSFVPEITSNR